MHRLPSIALPGAITSKLCNNPKKSNPVANVLAAVRNIVASPERTAISHQSPPGPVKLEVADRRRRVSDPGRWCSSLGILPLGERQDWQGCVCLPTRRMFLSQTVKAGKKMKKKKKKRSEATPSPDRFRGSPGAWTTLPQRLAGWTEHQASPARSRDEGEQAPVIIKLRALCSPTLPAPQRHGRKRRRRSSVPLLHATLCCWSQTEPGAWSPVSQRSEWRRSSRRSAGPPLSPSTRHPPYPPPPKRTPLPQSSWRV